MPRRSPMTTGSRSSPERGQVRCWPCAARPRASVRSGASVVASAGRPLVSCSSLMRAGSSRSAPRGARGGHASRPFMARSASRRAPPPRRRGRRRSRLTPSGCSGSARAADDRVEQHLGPRRTAGQVDVDRDDVVDALDDRVVVEHAAGAGADAHRDDPLGVGHLVVDLAHDRGHLLADPAGDDHQVGLARRGGEALHAEPGDVVVGRADGHHLDGAAGQAEGRRPDRGLAHVARRRSRPSSAGTLRAASLRFPSRLLAVRRDRMLARSVAVISPTRARRAATRRRRRRTR